MADPVPAVGPRALRILTLNCYCRPPGVVYGGAIFGDDLKSERLSALARVLTAGTAATTSTTIRTTGGAGPTSALETPNLDSVLHPRGGDFSSSSRDQTPSAAPASTTASAKDGLRVQAGGGSPPFDIVCFQELFAFGHPWRKRGFLRALAAGGLPYHSSHAYNPPRAQGSITNGPCCATNALSSLLPAWLGRYPPHLLDGGLCLTSRHRIMLSDSITFSASEASTADAWVAKGVQYAMIEAHEGPLYRAVRQQQMRELAAFVVARAPHPLPPGEVVLMCGDFNVDACACASTSPPSADSEEYAEMVAILRDVTGHMFVDILKESCGSHPPTADYGQPDGRRGRHKAFKRLDYIFMAQGTGHGTRGMDREACGRKGADGSWKCEAQVVEFRVGSGGLDARSIGATSKKCSHLDYLSDHFGVAAQIELNG